MLRQGLVALADCIASTSAGSDADEEEALRERLSTALLGMLGEGGGERDRLAGAAAVLTALRSPGGLRRFLVQRKGEGAPAAKRRFDNVISAVAARVSEGAHAPLASAPLPHVALTLALLDLLEAAPSHARALEAANAAVSRHYEIDFGTDGLASDRDACADDEHRAELIARAFARVPFLSCLEESKGRSPDPRASTAWEEHGSAVIRSIHAVLDHWARLGVDAFSAPAIASSLGRVRLAWRIAAAEIRGDGGFATARRRRIDAGALVAAAHACVGFCAARLQAHPPAYAHGVALTFAAVAGTLDAMANHGGPSLVPWLGAAFDATQAMARACGASAPLLTIPEGRACCARVLDLLAALCDGYGMAAALRLGEDVIAAACATVDAAMDRIASAAAVSSGPSRASTRHANAGRRANAHKTKNQLQPVGLGRGVGDAGWPELAAAAVTFAGAACRRATDAWPGADVQQLLASSILRCARSSLGGGGGNVYVRVQSDAERKLAHAARDALLGAALSPATALAATMEDAAALFRAATGAGVGHPSLRAACRDALGACQATMRPVCIRRWDRRDLRAAPTAAKPPAISRNMSAIPAPAPEIPPPAKAAKAARQAQPLASGPGEGLPVPKRPRGGERDTGAAGDAAEMDVSPPPPPPPSALGLAPRLLSTPALAIAAAEAVPQGKEGGEKMTSGEARHKVFGLSVPKHGGEEGGGYDGGGSDSDGPLEIDSGNEGA